MKTSSLPFVTPFLWQGKSKQSQIKGSFGSLFLSKAFFMPMFTDPATIKFVAKKFILATNDPKNPISAIRQIEASDTGKIQIFLTNGNSYQDEIDTLSDLISITSNKAFLVTLQFVSTLVLSYSKDLDEELKDEFVYELAKYFEIDPELNEKYYYEPSKMIPRRVIPKSVSTNLKGYPRWSSYESHQEFYLSGTTTVKFYVICPERDINELEDSLGEILTQRFRESLKSSKTSNFSGRNLDCVNHCEVELEEALLCPDEFMFSLGITHEENKCLASSMVGDFDDRFAVALNPIIDAINEAVRVTR